MPRLNLETLVDLEVQLLRDKQLEPAELRERDAAIGRAVEAESLDGPELFLGWLAELKKGSSSEQASPGQQVGQYVSLTGWCLFVGGVLLGASTVTGWLRLGADSPVNAVLFWGLLVGLQLAFLLGWIVAVVPRGWVSVLPGATGLQLLLQLIGRSLPMAIGWVTGRLSHEHRLLFEQVGGSVRRFDWLYGRIRFWLLVLLTQIFALAYNAGAIGAMLVLTHGNDPAFCWKSTMLKEQQVHAATRIIATPWRGIWPDATLSRTDVDLTRYSTLRRQYTNGTVAAEPSQAALRAWSTFLLASMVVYSLAPRCFTLLLAWWRAQATISGLKLQHADFQSLHDRLRRPFVETRSHDPDPEGGEVSPTTSTGGDEQVALGSGPYPVIQSNGVKLADDQVRDLIESRFAKGVSTVHRVLVGMDDGDSTVVDAVAQTAPEAVFMIVEAWEPPVEEYLDVLRDLRKKLGEGRLIDVLLYNRDPSGNATAPRERDLEMWRGKAAAFGDPWLRVEPLVEEVQA